MWRRRRGVMWLICILKYWLLSVSIYSSSILWCGHFNIWWCIYLTLFIILRISFGMKRLSTLSLQSRYQDYEMYNICHLCQLISTCRDYSGTWSQSVKALNAVHRHKLKKSLYIIYLHVHIIHSYCTQLIISDPQRTPHRLTPFETHYTIIIILIHITSAFSFIHNDNITMLSSAELQSVNGNSMLDGGNGHSSNSAPILSQV